MSSTSIGQGERRGGNQNHGSDGEGNKTLGEQSSQVPPTGAKPDAALDKAFPDGPNGGPSPDAKEAAEGKPPRR